jgi:Zn-dependent M28 family amino/carboxypeptidase
VGYIPWKSDDEYVLCTAHTDHLGFGIPPSSGDFTTNRAIDDASGGAALMEIGEAFANWQSSTSTARFPGRSLDLPFSGHESSTAGELLDTIAAQHGLTVGADPLPRENPYMRSDHYSFAERGVPGEMLLNNLSFEGKTEG